MTADSNAPTFPTMLKCRCRRHMGEILSAVIRHTHDLAREVRLQPGELLAAADFLRRCGSMWDTNGHGRYENVDSAPPDFNLRGRLPGAGSPRT